MRVWIFLIITFQLVNISTYAWVPIRVQVGVTQNSSSSSTIPTTCLNAVSSDVSIETFDGTKGVNTKIIIKAAKFMLESFWNISDDKIVKENSNILSEQISDLEIRHGEKLGKRKLFSNLIIAKESSSSFESDDDHNIIILGLVGVEVGLFDLTTKNILSYKDSEKVITDSVASLGPKQRRQYKDASIEELVKELPSLNGNYEAVAVLANLCVSTTSRGMGLGDKLCQALEDVVSRQWGMSTIMLKVEADNVPAKNLYNKLGYILECTNSDATTIRPDVENDSFLEIPCEILTLKKILCKL